MCSPTRTLESRVRIPLETHMSVYVAAFRCAAPPPKDSYQLCIRFANSELILNGNMSEWFLTAATRVRDWVWSCRICEGQGGTRAGFLRVLRFPLSIFIPPTAPQSPSSIIRGWYNRPVVAAVPSGLTREWSDPTCRNLP
jgi:hypothetical protein